MVGGYQFKIAWWVTQEPYSRWYLATGVLSKPENCLDIRCKVMISTNWWVHGTFILQWLVGLWRAHHNLKLKMKHPWSSPLSSMKFKVSVYVRSTWEWRRQNVGEWEDDLIICIVCVGKRSYEYWLYQSSIGSPRFAMSMFCCWCPCFASRCPRFAIRCPRFTVAKGGHRIAKHGLPIELWYNSRRFSACQQIRIGSNQQIPLRPLNYQ
mgnify:CR=1 FL=1